MIKRKIIYDAILNIIASTVPTLVLQMIILPIIGLRLGETEYGIAITLISMATLFSLPFGSVLNNIRLLMDSEYRSNDITGDFNILLIGSIVINAIVMIIGTMHYEGHFAPVSVLLVTLFSCLNLMREYLIVSFRIKINYKAILLNNLILGLGYLIGLIIFYLIGYWQIVYVFGASFSLIYIIKNSNLINESFSKTKLFSKITYKGIVLFFSVFMKTILTYADKLLLFPLLGPAAVSIYYSATLMGKIVAMVITPVSGVMLSYLAKMEKIKIKDFIKAISLTAIVGLIGYIVIIFVSGPVLNLLYPDWAEGSLDLIYLTTATAIIGVISSIIHPFLLRFNHINWQLIINAINIIIYTICVYMFYSLYGLVGFCLGMLIASVIKLIIMILIFILNYNNSEDRVPDVS
ncbi:lipopolysaccharide biosynthesis protein [Senegalia sp. (in: firmicutes)]|uniref:lipopolysaccharide biosynthesis protein n=1 Tax=Senegalia sp. (in: firmicutes) TaxID=1924098 RepID=UPI003F95860E